MILVTFWPELIMIAVVLDGYFTRSDHDNHHKSLPIMLCFSYI